MKKIIVAVITLLQAGAAKPQLPVPPDTLYTFMKYNSIHRNRPDWANTDKQFAACISSAKTIQDTMNCFVGVLKQLNDVHSQIYFNNKVYTYYHPVDDSVYKKIKPLMARAAAEVNQPVYDLLAQKYLYIRIPAMFGNGQADINRLAQAINDSICRYSEEKLKGFIIDLRLNTGGNMYPMLSGISSLLGNTIIGYETDASDSVLRQWEIRENNLLIGGNKVTAVKNFCGADHSKKPVAVLTGRLTASSGSMVAIACKGRPKTIQIGEPTAEGYTTSNNYYQFAPTLMLNFAVSFVADRRMIKHETSVVPDMILSTEDNFDNPAADPKVINALIWMKKLNK